MGQVHMLRQDMAAVVESALSGEAPARKNWSKPLGMPPSIENRSPDELNIDDAYQRSIDTGPSRSLIQKIAKGWDWRMCLPLVVSKREDGSLWVLDGQHRLAAAKVRGDIPYLPCCVSVYGGIQARGGHVRRHEPRAPRHQSPRRLPRGNCWRR
jgi:hypothetical protein